MRSAAIALLLAAAASATPAAIARSEPGRNAPARVCLSVPETRERILALKLADPFKLLRAQASEHRAEAIAVKLCQVGPTYVYVIDLLRRDGRLIHAVVDARSGRPVGAGGRR